MFSKNLTKEGYEVIIKDYLAPFMANHPMYDVRLIQDNDRKHSSELCISALAENNIQWVYTFLICYYALVYQNSIYSIKLY